MCLRLTDGILGEDGFGGFAGVSGAQLVLGHHPELVLAALHQVLDAVLRGRVQWISGGPGPPLGLGLLLLQDVVGDGLPAVSRPVPQNQSVGGVHLPDRWHLGGLGDSWGSEQRKTGLSPIF